MKTSLLEYCRTWTPYILWSSLCFVFNKPQKDSKTIQIRFRQTESKQYQERLLKPTPIFLVFKRVRNLPFEAEKGRMYIHLDYLFFARGIPSYTRKQTLNAIQLHGGFGGEAQISGTRPTKLGVLRVCAFKSAQNPIDYRYRCDVPGSESFREGVLRQNPYYWCLCSFGMMHDYEIMVVQRWILVVCSRVSGLFV